MKIGLALPADIQSASAMPSPEFGAIRVERTYGAIFDTRVWTASELQQGGRAGPLSTADTRMFMQTDLFGHAVADVLSALSAGSSMQAESEPAKDTPISDEFVLLQGGQLPHAGRGNRVANADQVSIRRMAAEVKLSTVQSSKGDAQSVRPAPSQSARSRGTSRGNGSVSAGGLPKALEERQASITQFGPVNAAALMCGAGISVFLRVGGVISEPAFDLIADMVRSEVSGRRLPIAGLTINAIASQPDQET